MDADTIRKRFNVEPPEFGYRILTFDKIDQTTVEFSAILTEKYSHAAEHGGDWLYSKYKCSGVRFLALELSIPDLEGYDEQFLQMFWEPERNCYLVEASAGFVFDCDRIEVLESSSEKLGSFEEAPTREQN